MTQKQGFLVADVGATFTRFAPVTDKGLGEFKVYQTKEYDSIQTAIMKYSHETKKKFSSAAIAVAGPILGGRVSLVNAEWSFSDTDLQKKFGFEKVFLFNDFEAVAMAIPGMIRRFEDAREGGQESGLDLQPIGGGTRIPGGHMAVLGPGTGLGVAGLVQAPGGNWLPIAGEGGHATMPATTDEERDVLNLLRLRWGHVSAERVLSGAGLVDLYLCLCLLRGVKPAGYRTPQEITGAAFGPKLADPLCVGAFRLFGSMLGTVAGNVALTFGAKGGVFISGGILPQYRKQFDKTPFRFHFESKGRLSDYVKAIPTYLVLHPATALQGLVDFLAGDKWQAHTDES